MHLHGEVLALHAVLAGRVEVELPEVVLPPVPRQGPVLRDDLERAAQVLDDGAVGVRGQIEAQARAGDERRRGVVEVDRALVRARRALQGLVVAAVPVQRAVEVVVAEGRDLDLSLGGGARVERGAVVADGRGQSRKG